MLKNEELNLQIVDRILHSVLPASPEKVRNSLSALMFSKKSKRIRPQLCFFVARLLSSSQTATDGADDVPDWVEARLSKKETSKHFEFDFEVYVIAALSEILHIASLAHDDVIDDAKQRRSVRTLNDEFGKKKAVLIGDFLVAQAMVLAYHHLPHQTMKHFPLAIRAMSLTELINFDKRNMRLYLRHIAAKTAALFVVSVRSISEFIFSKNPESQTSASAIVSDITKYAYQFGMAFQLKDDLLDFGDGQKTGKKALIDLENNSPNIVAILGGNYKGLSRLFGLYAKNPLLRKFVARSILGSSEVGALLQRTQKLINQRLLASLRIMSSDFCKSRVARFSEFSEGYFGKL